MDRISQVLVVEDSLAQRAHAVSLVEQLGERQMSVARRMTQLAHDLVYPCVVG